MKILMVSMFSNHFFNWAQQLENSDYELYWLDVFDSDTRVRKIDFVHQIIGWRYKWDYPGRYWVKRNRPIYNFINKFNERALELYFEKVLAEIDPDVVHSFSLQQAGYPILEVMKRHPQILWVYSAWGNDLYYRQQTSQEDLRKIRRTLPEVDFMFTDCQRDFNVAKEHGFQGQFLGAFPGGGGYDFLKYQSDILPQKKRNLILIKGYESHLGRCNVILRAVKDCEELLNNYEIVVFGGNHKVYEFCKENEFFSWNNFRLLNKIPHSEVLKLMGKALLYIGNSISDGMPNTLLEAIIMGAFPIQSNPGGATAEIVSHGQNGFLISNPEDPEEIRHLISYALKHPEILVEGVIWNNKNVRPGLEREFIREQVLAKYREIEKSIQANSR